MSKLSFRARALDAARPLPVYKRAELPQLTDCGFISRAVPQMPSGMDKDEELVGPGPRDGVRLQGGTGPGIRETKAYNG